MHSIFPPLKTHMPTFNKPIAKHLITFIVIPLGLAAVFTMPSAQGQTLTNHFVLKVKLDPKASEPSKIRDYARKVIGEEFELSRFSETYQKSGNNIRIRSEIPILKSLSVVGGPDQIIRSTTLIEQGSRLLLQQSLEQRGSRGDVYAAVIDHRRKKIQYTKNRGLVSEEIFDGAPIMDLTSLPYYWFGKPVVLKPVTLHITDSKKLRRNEVFVPNEVTIDFLGERQKVVKFTRKIKGQSHEPLEIWVRKDDGMPIRVTSSLKQEYGISLDLFPYKKAERS